MPLLCHQRPFNVDTMNSLVAESLMVASSPPYCNNQQFHATCVLMPPPTMRHAGITFSGIPSICPSVNSYFTWSVVGVAVWGRFQWNLTQIFITRVEIAEKVFKVRDQRSRSWPDQCIMAKACISSNMFLFTFVVWFKWRVNEWHIMAKYREIFISRVYSNCWGCVTRGDTVSELSRLW